MQGLKPEHIRNALFLIDQEKRREAYVTEWYFEKNILPIVRKGQTSCGWCYIQPDRNKKPRQWFKINYDPKLFSEERATDKRIIRALKSRSPSDRFFLLDFDKNSQAFKLREIVEDKLSVLRETTPKTDPPPKCEINAIKTRLDKLKTSVEKIGSDIFSNWLDKADEDYLARLFFQRLLMNEGLNQYYPTDVDAIDITDESLIFHEFKRKNKCPQGCLTNGEEINSKILFDILKVSKTKKLQDKQLIIYLEKSRKYKRDMESCFGLDLSHLINIEYCLQNNINYIYTIWNSSNHYKPRLEALFDMDIEPKETLSLLSYKIKSGDFRGVTFTTDLDSGSFHGKLRLQATIKESLFQKIHN